MMPRKHRIMKADGSNVIRQHPIQQRKYHSRSTSDTHHRDVLVGEPVVATGHHPFSQEEISVINHEPSGIEHGYGRSLGYEATPNSRLQSTVPKLNPNSKCRSRTTLSLIICFNIVFLMCALGQISMGSFIIWDPGRHIILRLVDSETPVVLQTGGALIGIGILSVITSILGFTNGLRSVPLAMYIIGVLVVVTCEVAFGVTFLLLNDKITVNLHNPNISSIVMNEYGFNQPLTQSVDYIQHRFKCCGINGEEEYEKSKWRSIDWKGGFEGSKWRLPLTCCPLDEEMSPVPSYMNPVPLNISLCQQPVTASNHRFSHGCRVILEDWLKTQAFTLIGMEFTILLLQIAAVSAAICVWCKIK